MPQGTAAPAARAWAAIAGTWLIAGTLDITENLIYNHFRAVTPTMVFQYIASGLIGMRAFSMGSASVVIGVLVHYSIALTWTAIFYALSRKLAVLRQRPILSGAIYGAAMYVFMTWVVLPLTRVPPPRAPVTMVARINGVLALVFCMGITVALLVRRADRAASAS